MISSLEDSKSGELLSWLFISYLVSLFSYRFDFGKDRERHCTVPLSKWRELLNGSGFTCDTFSLSHPDEDHSLVFLAQKTGDSSVISNGLVSSDCSSEDTIYQSTPGSITKEISPMAIIEEIYVSDSVFPFARGQEMRLREELVKLDPAEATSVWIMATDGPDGDAARGLTRTLCKELPAWKIHLIVFDPSWGPEQRRTTVAKLQEETSVEPEVKIDANGAVYVPRVVPLPSPVLETAFDATKTWTIIDGKVIHTSLPPLGPFDVIVEVSHWSSLDTNSPRAFVGTISNKGTSDFTAGDWVMGLTDASVSNSLVAHAGSLVPCQSTHSRLLPDVPGFIHAILALGPGTLRRTGRLAAIQHALVTDVHTTVGQAVVRILKELGVDSFCVGEGEEGMIAEVLGVPAGKVSSAVNALWVARQRCLYDLILSGAQAKADVQLITQLGAPQGVLHFWNSEAQCLGNIVKRDPWLVAHALEVVLQTLPVDYASSADAIPIADAAPVPRGTPVVDAACLFDPSKAYILIGGIGGMGVQMARWMYEVS